MEGTDPREAEAERGRLCWRPISSVALTASCGIVNACLILRESVCVCWTNRRIEGQRQENIKGTNGLEPYVRGDTLQLVLDTDAATLRFGKF